MKHLRKSFDEMHWNFGYTTELLCFWKLHGEQVKGGTKNFHEYLEFLPILKERAGAAATHRFDKFLEQGTPPAIFKAYYELYIEGMKLQAKVTFQSLLLVGRSNLGKISLTAGDWAKRVTEEMIHYHVHRVPSWIKGACDEQPYNRSDDPDEMIYWRSWRAPNLIVMEPSRFANFDPDAAWERNDQQISEKWLEAFKQDYVLRLEIEVRKLAGTAALEQAMLPPIRPQEPLVSQTFNLRGHNQRVNINSTDNSTNIVQNGTPFAEIRSALEAGIADGLEKSRLFETLQELESSKDRETASTRYGAFVTLAANHMTLLTPFLPALAHWLHTLAPLAK